MTPYFFDKSTEVEFMYFSLPHIIPILVMIGVIFLIYKKRDKIKIWKHEESLRVFMSFLTLMGILGYYWYKAFQRDATPVRDLPLAICEWSAIFSIFMLLSSKKTFFEINYFWVLCSSIFALLMPATIQYTGPTRFRYYQFWTLHLMIFINLFYVLFVFDHIITFKSLLKSLFGYIIVVMFAIYVNAHIEGANYLFIAKQIDGGTPLDYFPPNLLIKVPILFIMMSGIFLIAYLPWYFKNKKETVKKDSV